MTKFQMSVIVAALSAILGLSASSSADTVPPNPVQAKIQRNIVSNAALLTKVAYVNSKSHTKTEWVEGKVFADDSFTLTYKFFYRDSDNDPQIFTLRFTCSKAGQVEKIEMLNRSPFEQVIGSNTLLGKIHDEIAKELSK